MQNINVLCEKCLEVLNNSVDKLLEMCYVSVDDISKIEIQWKNIGSGYFAVNSNLPSESILM